MDRDEKKAAAPIDELISIRREKKDRIRELGHHPYDNRFFPSHTTREIRDNYAGKPPPAEHTMDPLDQRTYGIAGRVLTLRSFGKAAFFHLLDPAGPLQVYVKKDVLPEQDFALFKEIDAGDFLGIEGKMFYTKTGELTLMAERLHFITKSLRPLPEKWHGLVDPELRYRQRYLDLLSNEQVKEIFIARSCTVSFLRDYLVRAGFIEVETPMLHHLRGGATARPFVTHHNVLGTDFFLRIAPELYLKRLLVGGFGKVFELGKCFRNEGVSTKHNPEFTILEFYEAYADYMKVLGRAEEMVKEVERRIHEKFPHLREKRGYDIQAPWKRMRMVEAVCLHGAGEGIDRNMLGSEALCRAWYEKTFPTEQRKKGITHGEIIFVMFERLAEPNLGSAPVAILDFPADVSPLARRKDGDPMWVDRFEVYMDGREIINAFSELNDPAVQAQSFALQVQARTLGDEEAMDYDHDYVTALEHGMPPAGGFGLGVDRLVMSLCRLDSIREAILFPALRPEREEEERT
jgi:lysyl-tRNA synthetase class 2